MSKASFGQIGNMNSSKSIRCKLKVTDYVFNYLNQDLSNAYLEYYFDEFEFVQYKNSKVVKKGKYPIMFFSISATLNDIDYSFDFALEKSLDELNCLEINDTKNITEFINEGGTQFKGNDEFEPIYFPSKDNFYSYDPVFKVTKLDINKNNNLIITSGYLFFLHSFLTV